MNAKTTITVYLNEINSRLNNIDNTLMLLNPITNNVFETSEIDLLREILINQQIINQKIEILCNILYE
jgi:hypothetical protein